MRSSDMPLHLKYSLPACCWCPSSSCRWWRISPSKGPIDALSISLVQVYTAEEKAALAMYNFEENKKKEEKIIGDMQRLVDDTLGSSGEESE